MYRRAGVVLIGVVALVAGSCASGHDSDRVVATRPSPTTVSTSTTAATIAAAPAAPPTHAAAAAHIQRVRVLPGERPVKVSKASYHGPTPTGRITIPSIGLNHLTYEGIELSTIDYGPSHWPGTAMPGQVGNTVFPGHRVTHDHPFFDIDLINIGDQVIFTNDTGRYTYQVTDHFVVDDEEMSIANPTDTPTFTIFACHPKHSAQQRYVVKGKLVAVERANNPSGAPSGDGATYAPPQPPGDTNPPPTTTTTRPPSVIPHIGG
jgi:sortase A